MLLNHSIISAFMSLSEAENKNSNCLSILWLLLKWLNHSVKLQELFKILLLNWRKKSLHLKWSKQHDSNSKM